MLKHNYFSRLSGGLKKLLLLILLFFYVYPIEFVFLPFHTRNMIALLGFFWIYKYILDKKFVINKWVFYGMIISISIVLLSCLTMIINMTSDWFFVRQVIVNILTFCSVFCIIKTFKSAYRNISFYHIANWFVIVVLIQMFITLFMFMDSSFRDLLTDIQRVDLLIADRLGVIIDGGIRFVGFGSFFFGAGVTNGFSLILISLLFKKKTGIFSSLFYIFCFIVIMSVGSIMSRTTLVGGAIALVVLLCPPKNIQSLYDIVINKKKLMTTLGSLIAVVMALVILIPEEMRLDFTYSIEYGFEMFVNFVDGYGFMTDSTNELLASFVFPNRIRTYFIGDGYFAHPYAVNEIRYYMDIDTGYLRLLFYFGLPGLFLFMLFQITPILYAKKCDPNNRRYFYSILLYIVILNIKGLVNLFPYTILFVFCEVSRVRNFSVDSMKSGLLSSLGDPSEA